tara:strand:- start:95 stop:289 length:195 start_codon:yes stop_codon:yes gene_type:complete
MQFVVVPDRVGADIKLSDEYSDHFHNSFHPDVQAQPVFGIVNNFLVTLRMLKLRLPSQKINRTT